MGLNPDRLVSGVVDDVVADRLVGREPVLLCVDRHLNECDIGWRACGVVADIRHTVDTGLPRDVGHGLGAIGHRRLDHLRIQSSRIGDRGVDAVQNQVADLTGPLKIEERRQYAAKRAARGGAACDTDRVHKFREMARHEERRRLVAWTFERGKAVTEDVRCIDREMLGERIDHPRPSFGADAEAMNQQQCLIAAAFMEIAGSNAVNFYE